MELQYRIKELGLTQAQLVKELTQLGFEHVNPQNVSISIRKLATYPKAKQIYQACESIVEKYERERKL